MNSALATCGARIEAALEYLAHEPDPIRAITLAETQLRQARVSLRAAQEPQIDRRSADAAPTLTFLAGVAVKPNPWPPAEKSS